MKKYVILIISLFFIGVSNVFAETEISINIDSDDNVTIKDAVANTEITENKSNYYSYSNGTLTLKEGYKYSSIVFTNDITITTNNKKLEVASIYTNGTATLTLNKYVANIYN